jgi:hypothetical protein
MPVPVFIADSSVMTSLPVIPAAFVFGGQAEVDVGEVEMNLWSRLTSSADTSDPQEDVCPTEFPEKACPYHL